MRDDRAPGCQCCIHEDGEVSRHPPTGDRAAPSRRSSGAGRASLSFLASISAGGGSVVLSAESKHRRDAGDRAASHRSTPRCRTRASPQAGLMLCAYRPPICLRILSDLHGSRPGFGPLLRREAAGAGGSEPDVAGSSGLPVRGQVCMVVWEACRARRRTLARRSERMGRWWRNGGTAVPGRSSSYASREEGRSGAGRPPEPIVARILTAATAAGRVPDRRLR